MAASRGPAGGAQTRCMLYQAALWLLTVLLYFSSCDATLGVQPCVHTSSQPVSEARQCFSLTPCTL